MGYPVTGGVGTNSHFHELEGIYGCVQSSERLKEQFYSEHQRPDECVADYSLRLERLLSRVPGPIHRSARSEMLRNRLWSGLRDLELKNASRYLFEKEPDYNTLRKELRAIEEDLRQSRASASISNVSKPEVKQEISAPAKDKKPDVVDPVAAKQFAATVESRLLNEIQTMAKQIERMDGKISGMEKDLRELKVERANRRPWYGGKPKATDTPKDQKVDKPDLNADRPQS